MKDYIKPTFVLAGVSPVSLNSVGCSTSRDDLDLISAILSGKDIADPNVFTITESCVDSYDLDMYCKYTAESSGATKVLGS